MESSITNYQLDIEELTKFIEQSTRPNIKRQLEENRKNLIILLEEEKRKAEKASQTEKQNQIINEKKADQPSFVSISKYALDSGDKFVK